MITEKVTWVRFSARISAVCSTPFLINDLVFQSDINIFAIIFLRQYRTRKYIQLCCINSANFFPFFYSLFYANLVIPKKTLF